MLCPRDGQPLATAQIEAFLVDWCPQCHGLWFEQGELEQLLDSTDLGVESTIDVLSPIEKDSGATASGYMRCPKCTDGRLQGITYTLESRIRIDRCEECLGVWLDRKELDGILQEKKKLDAEYSIGTLVTETRRSLKGRPH